MEKLHELYLEMIKYYAGDPKRIQHFIKVHSLARFIGTGEHLSPEELFTLEAAAIVHDIGIKAAVKKYNSTNGKYQEELGEPLARQMLSSLDFPPEVTRRVSFLVGRHHTYCDVDKSDWQILLEADLLVNLYEDSTPREAIAAAQSILFKTKTARELCRVMYGVDNVDKSEK